MMRKTQNNGMAWQLCFPFQWQQLSSRMLQLNSEYSHIMYIYIYLDFYYVLKIFSRTNIAEVGILQELPLRRCWLLLREQNMVQIFIYCYNNIIAVFKSSSIYQG